MRDEARRFTVISILSIMLSCVGVVCASEGKSVIDQAPKEIAPVNAPFDMPQFKRPVFADRTFNIKDFGAVEGGKVLNRKAINKAITAASKAGGGKVLIPAGKWLTGAIELKSNVNLHLDKDALVLFSGQLKDYLPGVFSRTEGLECIKPSGLIYAFECDNIAVTGKGRLHGQGKPWWGNRETRKMTLDGKTIIDGTKHLQELCAKGGPVAERIFDGTKGELVRPSFINPVRCTNVFIEGVTVLYGPMWTVNPVYCENVIIRKVQVITEGEYGHTPNGDGINPDSCKNVLIEYCDTDTGDDCFTIKSGRAEDGLRVGIPCENIVIRNCNGRRGHGGVVIGSETSGGIKNIFIRDCTFDGTDRGLRLKTARGRGAVIENVWVQNIKMGTILKEAILVNTLRYTKRYPAHPLSDRTPTYRNLNFRDITCEYSKKPGINIIGLPEKPMKGLRFENIDIKGAEGIRIQDAGDIVFKNVNITPDSGPVLRLDESFDVTINGMKFPKDAIYLELIGKKTKGIKLRNVDVKKGSDKIIYGDGVSKDAVSLALPAKAEIVAFPTAEGAGKFTKGGRGGDVYHVTNLKDSGTGSLREGIETIKGPRTIVFDVAGMIRLKTDLEIIDKSHLTIAGQTAPGKGITLSDHCLQIKQSDHIIVRYLRVRLGDENKPAGSAPDCITVEYDDRIILDHLSLSWGIDGNGDFRGLKHSTVQWTIFSEALHDSLHKKGGHAMCTSFRDSAGPATLHHNIYASSRSRHPSVTGSGSDVLEFCNNLDYNWQKGNNISGDKLNLINNYYKAGPSMHVGFCPIQFKSGKKPPSSKGYLSGNYFEGLPKKYNRDNYTAMDYKASGLGFNFDYGYQDTTRENFEVSKRFDAGKYKLTKIESAKDAYESCLKYSGCSLVRDTVDERFIRTIIDNTGKIIDSQNDVGGWDTYACISRQKGFDTDRDGMADAWEIARGLSPNDTDDRNDDDDSDGYTNLEEYINSLVESRR